MEPVSIPRVISTATEGERQLLSDQVYDAQAQSRTLHKAVLQSAQPLILLRHVLCAGGDTSDSSDRAATRLWAMAAAVAETPREESLLVLLLELELEHLERRHHTHAHWLCAADALAAKATATTPTVSREVVQVAGFRRRLEQRIWDSLQLQSVSLAELLRLLDRAQLQPYRYLRPFLLCEICVRYGTFYEGSMPPPNLRLPRMAASTLCDLLNYCGYSSRSAAGAAAEGAAVAVLNLEGQGFGRAGLCTHRISSLLSSSVLAVLSGFFCQQDDETSSRVTPAGSQQQPQPVRAAFGLQLPFVFCRLTLRFRLHSARCACIGDTAGNGRFDRG